MEIRSYCPFEPFWFKAKDAEDARYDVVVVKATYRLVEERTLEIAEAQEPVTLADAYYGEPALSSVRYESDLAPFKPRADVVVNGDAYAPRGEPAPSWRVSVFVGETQRELEVHGPRRWERGEGGWTLGEAEPVARVPMRYEHAFGGTVEGEEGPLRCATNPVGVGWWPKEGAGEPPDELDAPRIVEPASPPSAPTDEDVPPAGLGWTGRSWQPRLALAGTYDEAWKRDQWPLSPKDFDMAFYNGAAEGMRFEEDLTGVPVSVLHMSESGRVAFRVPPYRVDARFRYVDGRIHTHETTLDTLVVDLPEARVLATHRVRVPERDELRVLEVLYREGPRP